MAAAAEHHPGSARSFTIQLPGLADTIHLPGRENAEHKSRLIKRLQTGESPIPEPLRWIPRVINWLDSAQDLLYVALVAGKYLLPTVAKRFLGPLGWVLTLNDILNLMTNGLGLFMGGRVDKLDYCRLAQAWTVGRPARIEKAAKFLSHTPWLGFLLQAGQVLYDWTGYGLSLGAIMGTVSDAFWGAIRVAQGDKVKIELPPEMTSLWTASKVAIQSAEMSHVTNYFDDNEKAILFGAHYVAISILNEAYISNAWDERTYEAAGFRYPDFQLTDETSRAAMRAAGMNPDAPTPPMFPVYDEQMTVLQAVQFASGRVAPLYLDLNGVVGNDSLSQFSQTCILESAIKAWSMSAEPPVIEHSLLAKIERAQAAQIEFGIYPPVDNPPWCRPLYTNNGTPDNSVAQQVIFDTDRRYDSCIGRPPLSWSDDPPSQLRFKWLKRAAILHTQEYVPFKFWGFGPQPLWKPRTLYAHPRGGYPLFSSLPTPDDKTVVWLGPGSGVWAAVEVYGNCAFRKDRATGEYLY